MQECQDRVADEALWGLLTAPDFDGREGALPPDGGALQALLLVLLLILLPCG